WRPHNVNEKFYGPTRLRTALVHSRNLVSIRLLQAIGLDYAINYLHRFGFSNSQLPKTLTLALGACDINPLQLAMGYAVFANGGYQVKPFLIASVAKENDGVIYQHHPLTVCRDCSANDEPVANTLPAPQMISPQNAYLITNVMQDVIQNGTGRKARELNRMDIAGKTGTTNKQMDAWFSGFNSNIVTTVWMGFDAPKSLREFAAQTALPIWIDFMREALKGTKDTITPQPANIVNVKIDPRTGLLAAPDQKDAVFEIFREKDVPTEMAGHNAQNHDIEDSAESQLY
ncbi:MAG: peptidase, partial [Coxiellaceae bacterium]|nr:peptidase [Coxiellaceae bacterium]